MGEYFGFSATLPAISAGRMVARASWPLGTFVFRQVPATIAAEVIPNMQSLPPAVKEEFARRGTHIRYDNQLALVDSQSKISGYSPSVADLMADDWFIL